MIYYLRCLLDIKVISGGEHMVVNVSELQEQLQDGVSAGSTGVEARHHYPAAPSGILKSKSEDCVFQYEFFTHC